MKALLLKTAVCLLLLGPFGYLVYELSILRLGANPVEAMLHTTGTWALRLLLLTLLLTPLSQFAGLRSAVSYRRLIGLVAFFYALMHLLIYLWLEHQWAWPEVFNDVFKRPYITVGFTAFVILLALALTSFKAAMRALGRRWKVLHRGVYAAAFLACLHYLWLVKADLLLPSIYTMVFALLMLCRHPWVRSRVQRR